MVTARPAVAPREPRGIAPAPVLRAAGLSREALASIDNSIPKPCVHRLWEAAAEAARDPSFGLHAAETLPPGAFDVVEYIMSTAETVQAGLARLTRYVRLIDDASQINFVIEPGSARIVRRALNPSPQYDEFSMALLFLRARQFTGARWTPERVSFQHRRHDDGELRRVFRCPVEYGAPATEMRLASSILHLPHVHADSRLLAILERYADSLLASRPARGSLVARVSATIAHGMGDRLPRLADVASAVRVPVRTLQRRLAAEGLSHSALVDDVRRNLALRYLGDAGLSIGEIGFLLHFADSTAFHRAFKRWTGESPLRYRRRLFAA